jgi:sugar phosphate isomerase/epimerase
MSLTRRELLAACAGCPPALLALAGDGPHDAPAAGERPRPRPLGVVIHSYGQRVAADRARGGPGRFDDAFVFLEYCHALGARGVQVGLGARDEAGCARLRARAEALGMDLEGSVRLPRDGDGGDLDRFAAEVRTAARAGARVLRTVLLEGRRYEVFASAAAFRRAADAALRSLALAEPVAARHDVRLAVENHKDWRADELIAILKRIDSAHVAVCLDTGNSIALLEDPIAVVEALAPWAATVHLKDMAVEESGRGFRLAEVPLGTGFLDLGRIARTLRAAHPEIRLNLEMITRDPLEVPCLSEGYWATFADLPGRHLARTLRLVRAHAAKDPLPRVSGLTPEARLKLEDDNVRRCLAFARAELLP